MGHLLGFPALVLPHEDFREICRTWLGIWFEREAGRTLQQPALRSWKTKFLLQYPRSRPSQWLAYLQSQDGSAVWPENSVGCRSAWFGISNEEPRPAWPEHLEAIVQQCSSSLTDRANWPQSKSRGTFWPGKYRNLSKLIQFPSLSLSLSVPYKFLQ